MTAEHTPGGWRLEHGEHGWVIRLGEHRHLYAGDRDDEGVANLRLMASAPDLLAVAERVNATLLDLCRGYGVEPEGQAWIVATVEQARAAIAKATGEASS